MAAITADGKRVFTSNVTSGSVSEIDLVERKFVRAIPVAPKVEGIAVTPDGSLVFAGSNTDGTVSIIDTQTAPSSAHSRASSSRTASPPPPTAASPWSAIPRVARLPRSTWPPARWRGSSMACVSPRGEHRARRQDRVRNPRRRSVGGPRGHVHPQAGADDPGRRVARRRGLRPVTGPPAASRSFAGSMRRVLRHSQSLGSRERPVPGAARFPRRRDHEFRIRVVTRTKRQSCVAGRGAGAPALDRGGVTVPVNADFEGGFAVDRKRSPSTWRPRRGPVSRDCR